jgi:hypothetical protein
MKLIIQLILLLVSIITLTHNTLAQGGAPRAPGNPGDPGDSGDPCWPPEDCDPVSINHGLFILVISGVLFALYFSYKKNTVGKVDVDNNPEIASKFGIRNIPTLLFMKKLLANKLERYKNQL